MRYVFLGNDLTTWSIAFGIGLSVCFLLYFAKRLVVRRLALFAATTTTYLDDLAVQVLSATHPLFFVLMGVYAGAQSLVLRQAPRRTRRSALSCVPRYGW